MTDTTLPDGFVLDDEAPTVTRRGAILPVAEYSDGTASLAAPQWAYDAIGSFSRLLYGGGYQPGTQDEEGVRDAFKVANVVTGGSMVAIRPAASLGAGGRVGPYQVLDWLKRAGVQANKHRASTGTEYVQFKDPNVPKGAQPPVINEMPVVRIPKDNHSGRPATDAQVANRFDTAPPHKPFWRFSAPTENRGGGKFSEWDNLEAALKWRTSRSPDGQWLIRPDQEPRGARYPKRAEPDKPAEMPPEQLKLLSGGLPPGFILDDDMSHDDVRLWIEGAH